MSDKHKEDKPMTTNTVEEILKQDYDIIKTIKKKPESDYAQLYKKMLENKNNTQSKKK